ncbi:MAG: flagellar export chaperone FlgN [Planctomycetes bacterium]|nr:flagellar export chaperone FlgN [Planctomycetota bacterium]
MDDLLGCEEEVQRRLIALARRIRAAVTAMDRPAIEETTTEQELLGGRARDLETRRRALLRSLLGAEAEGKTLGTLLERIPAPHREALAARRRTLLDLARTLGTLNRLNRLLVERSLGHLDRFARLMMGADEAPLTYGPPRRNASSGRVLVDQRA